LEVADELLDEDCSWGSSQHGRNVGSSTRVVLDVVCRGC
jgi:hypothetical protein